LFSIVLALSAGLIFSVGCAGDGGESMATGETWTDPATGLTWQVEPESGYVSWEGAGDVCGALSLAGQADWRLPTISELRTLVRGCPSTESDGSCGVTDECLGLSCQDESCYDCEPGNGPTDGCYGRPELSEACDYLWSSSGVDGGGARAWALGFTGAFVYKPRTFYGFHARCVRP
jgi:hypothetical protein